MPARGPCSAVPRRAGVLVSRYRRLEEVPPVRIHAYPRRARSGSATNEYLRGHAPEEPRYADFLRPADGISW